MSNSASASGEGPGSGTRSDTTCSTAEKKTRGDLSAFYGGEDELCPICLDNMPPMTWRSEERTLFSCCGNFACTSCRDHSHSHREGVVDQILSLPRTASEHQRRELMEQWYQSRACPLCRAQPPKSEKEHFERELECAKRGHATAQLHIGLAYERGDEGCGRDLVQAVHWFKLSAEQGHPAAMCMYAECLEDGKGVSQSYSEARRLYERCVDVAEYPRAQTQLAMMYMDGKGVAKDSVMARKLLQQSADQGYPHSQYNLGVLFLTGDCGFPKDNEKALDLFTKAAEQGNERAMYNAGITLMAIAEEKTRGYTNIAGQCPNPRAVMWFRKAAALGLPEAADNARRLDYMYSGGCANCFKERGENNANLLRCTGCRLMHYCSKDCAVKHWKAGHKKDCCKHSK